MIDELDPGVRYQLLHRTASVVIEAKRFHATTAVMIVHSFSPELKWLESWSMQPILMILTFTLVGQEGPRGIYLFNLRLFYSRFERASPVF